MAVPKTRTLKDDWAYLVWHWGTRYWVVRPCPATDGKWSAVAKFARGDELTADTATGLLDQIRRHYPGIPHKAS